MEALKDVQICDHGQSDGDCAGCKTASDVAAIVQTTDPKVIALAQTMLQVPTDDLMGVRADASEFIEQRTREFNASIEQDRLTLKLADAILMKRIVDAGGKALPSDEYDVHLEFTKSIEKRLDVLSQLEGKVPEQELRKALYYTQPKPELKADATQLRKLARTYGGEIASIVDAGLVDTFSRPSLAFGRREPDKHAQSLETPVQRTPIGGA
jgi:hypothetical protein